MRYLRASMPGNFFPARKSTIAPPPVEMKLNFLSSLYCFKEHHRLSPAGDGECLTIAPDGARDGDAGLGILFLFDQTKRTAPDDRPRRGDLFFERVDGFRADIQNGISAPSAPHKIRAARSHFYIPRSFSAPKSPWDRYP